MDSLTNHRNRIGSGVQPGNTAHHTGNTRLKIHSFGHLVPTASMAMFDEFDALFVAKV